MDHPEVLLQRIRENVRFLWPRDRAHDPLYRTDHRLLTCSIYDTRPQSHTFGQRYEKVLVVSVDVDGTPSGILVETNWSRRALLELHAMLSDLVATLFIGNGFVDPPGGNGGDGGGDGNGGGGNGGGGNGGGGTDGRGGGNGRGDGRSGGNEDARGGTDANARDNIRDPRHNWYHGPHYCGPRQPPGNLTSQPSGHQRHLSAPAASPSLPPLSPLSMNIGWGTAFNLLNQEREWRNAQRQASTIQRNGASTWEQDGHSQPQDSTANGTHVSGPQLNPMASASAPATTQQPVSPALRYPSITSVLHHPAETQAHTQAPNTSDSFELSSAETWTPADPDQDRGFQRDMLRPLPDHRPIAESPLESEFSGASYETWTPPGIYTEGDAIGDIRRTSGNRTGIQYNLETPTETEFDSRVQGKAWARQPWFYVGGGPHDPNILRAAAANQRGARNNNIDTPSNATRNHVPDNSTSEPSAARMRSATIARGPETADASWRRTASGSGVSRPLPVYPTQPRNISSQAPEIPPLERIAPFELPVEHQPIARRQSTFALGPVPSIRPRDPSTRHISSIPTSIHRPSSSTPATQVQTSDSTISTTLPNFPLPDLTEQNNNNTGSRRPSTSLGYRIQQHPNKSDETVLHHQQPQAGISSTDTVVPTRRNVTPHPVLASQNDDDDAAGDDSHSPAEQSLHMVRQRYTDDETEGPMQKAKRKVKQLGRRVSRGFSGGSAPEP